MDLIFVMYNDKLTVHNPERITSVVISNLVTDTAVKCSIEIAVPDKFSVVIDDYVRWSQRPVKRNICLVDRRSLNESLQLADYLEDNEYFDIIVDILFSGWIEYAVLVYQELNEHIQNMVYLRLPYQLLPLTKQHNDVFMHNWYDYKNKSCPTNYCRVIADMKFCYNKRVTYDETVIDKFTVDCNDIRTNNMSETHIKYFPNGKVNTIAELKRGVYHGYYKQYYDDKHHSYEECRHVNGQKYGQQNMWYRSQETGDYELRSSNFFLKDELHGPSKTWRYSKNTGKQELHLEAMYTTGRTDGIQRNWNIMDDEIHDSDVESQNWAKKLIALSPSPNKGVIMGEHEFANGQELPVKIKGYEYHRIYMEVDKQYIELLSRIHPTKQLYGKYYVLIESNEP